MSLIRIIISDADGTLLSNGKLKYPRDFERMLKETAERDVPFVVASGRTFESLKRIFSDFADRLIFCSFDGAYISAGSTPIADFPIDRASVDHALRLDPENVIGAELCTAKRSYLSSKSTSLHDLEKRRLGEEYAVFDSIPESVYKIIVFTKRGKSVDIPGLHRVYQSDRVSEFVREGIDKSSAAKLLCTELSTDPSELIAFGDGENDRTLLELSGCPVTIYGAKHEIFALSERHTANVAEYARMLIKQLQ